MPRVIEKTVFKYDELSERAKDRARDWYSEGALDYDWWESVYEDASQVGIKIKSFDTGRGREIKIELEKCITDVIGLILVNHGEKCDTYKTAVAYNAELVALSLRYNGDLEDMMAQEELDDIKDEFIKEIGEDYLNMLDDECEYLTSDECIVESILANDYEFDEDGRRT